MSFSRILPLNVHGWIWLLCTYHLRLIFLQQSSSHIRFKLHCALKALQHKPRLYLNHTQLCSTAQRRKSLTVLKKHHNREQQQCLREQWNAFPSGWCSKSFYISLAWAMRMRMRMRMRKRNHYGTTAKDVLICLYLWLFVVSIFLCVSVWEMVCCYGCSCSSLNVCMCDKMGL